jgi:parvulin-like peptidyl-prolyl isomerase
MTDFLKVDGAEIDLKTALQWRIAIGDDDFIQETVTDASVVQYCKSQNISVSKDEIQNVFAEFRYAQGMESADETKNWMSENGLSQAAMAQVCEIIALRNALRKEISDDECREEFSLNQTSFDVAEIYNITVDDEDLANEIMSQIDEDDDSFYNLAVEHSVDEETYLKAGYTGEVTRDGVRAEAESLIFSAEDGSVVGPVKEGDQYTIYMVRRIMKPDFDDIKETIRDRLFEEFLEGLPGTVKVELTPLGTTTDPIDVSDDDEDEDEE